MYCYVSTLTPLYVRPLIQVMSYAFEAPAKKAKRDQGLQNFRKDKGEIDSDVDVNDIGDGDSTGGRGLDGSWSGNNNDNDRDIDIDIDSTSNRDSTNTNEELSISPASPTTTSILGHGHGYESAPVFDTVRSCSSTSSGAGNSVGYGLSNKIGGKYNENSDNNDNSNGNDNSPRFSSGSGSGYGISMKRFSSKPNLSLLNRNRTILYVNI